MDNNKSNIDKLLKLVTQMVNFDEFIYELIKSPRWYLDDRTKLWKKDDFRRFYSQVKEAIGE